MIKRLTLTGLLVSLVFCLFARDFKSDALAYLKQNKKQFNLSDQDIADLKLTDQYTDEDAANITHIWFQQTAYGVGLYNSSIALHVNVKGEIAHFTGDGVLDLRSHINTPRAAVSVQKAITIAVGLMSSNPAGTIKEIGTTKDGRMIFDKMEGVTNDPIYVRPVYFRGEDNSIKLGWEVTIETLTHEHAWSFHLDATTGAMLRQIDNVVHCNFETTSKYNNVFTVNANKSVAKNSNTGNLTSSGSQSNSTAAAETSTYNVYPFYTEAPTFGPRVSISSPADAVASPYGWNDVNGVAGADGTLTTGNNVDAYTDKDANDNPDANSRPNGTATLNFDFPLDLTQRTDTLANVKAVVTQLYYMNNIMHDISYKYGFTEAAGNFQKNNYSRGGTASDYVKAEALDGSGTSNANFQSPVDGSSGRMQMYMWPVLSRPILYINAPAPIKDTVTETAKADFGPCSFNVTGTCVVANDGSAHPTYACNALVNSAAMSGKIAIVDRNDCNFFNKVLNCQNAGAIGVIVVNRVDSLLGGMALPAGEDPSTITIPSLFVLKSVGDALKANIATLNVTLFNDPANCSIPAFNGSFDNGVVAHEYTHGISIRLTGGPSNSSCLSNNEEAGEGWSDFLGLALTHKAGDTRTTERGVGTYVVGQSPTDPGIRNYPYTTDMTVNPLTYASLPTLNCQTNLLGACIANSAEVHELGEVWTAMLWEMYWNLIDKLGYSSDLYTGTAGNNRAIKLVIAGMTYQPCSPGFVDARNAILKADSILYAKADYCEIWRAFAKRGLGFSAKQGSSANTKDGTAAYDLPPACSGNSATASFTASDTTVCQGASLTFTNTSTATSGSPDSVRWTIAGGTPTTSTSTTTVSPVFSGAPGTYTISLIAYKGGNPSSPATKSIRIKANPTVGVNSPSICSGSTASLTATGATTYTWTNSLPSTAIVTTPVLTGNASYTVTGTTAGCSGTAVASVTVKTNPGVSVNSPTICAGTTANLTASGATTYTWTGSLPANATVTTPTLTTTTPYTVTGTTNGCTGTAVATVTVTPLPNVAVNSPSICSGQTATLTATGATSYTWTGSLPSTAIVTTPVLNSSTSYTVTGTSSGCSKTAVASVTVNTTAPTVVITPNPASVCLGDAITLTASGANNYVWDQPGGVGNQITLSPSGNITVGVQGTLTGCSTTGSASVSITVKQKPTVAVNSPSICSGTSASLTATGATTYTWTGSLPSTAIVSTPVLTGNASYTVTGTTAGCTGTAVSTVTVKTLPPTALSASTNNTCAGDAVTLTASGATTYSWSPSGSGTVVNINPTSSVTYIVTGTTNGCDKTASQAITVTPIPGTPSITQSGDTLYSSVIVAGASYEWYKGGILTATTGTPFYHIASAGSYTLKVVKNTCSSLESAAFGAIFTVIKNGSNSIKIFEVYPNPTEGKLVMNLNLYKNANVQIAVYSPEGRELYNKAYSTTKNVYEELNIATYAKGVYIIKLSVDNETYYHKVVKD